MRRSPEAIERQRVYQREKRRRLRATPEGRAYVVEQVLTRKRAIQAWFKEQPFRCVVCGESRIGCLDFHHRDPSQKKWTISRMVTSCGHSIKKVKEEMAKCDVLCSNCHRLHHYEERKQRQDAIRAASLTAPQPLVAPHGIADVNPYRMP